MATRCKLVDSIGALQTKGLKQDRFTVLAMFAADWTMLLMLMAATRLMPRPSVPKS